MRGLRVRYAVTAGCAAVVVLAGCGGGEEEPSPSPSSTSASPSGSPTVVPPEIPAGAKGRHEAGAKAFLKFFFDEFNRGQRQPGTVDIFAISDPECRACRNIQDALQEYVDDGVHVRDNPLLLVDVRVSASNDVEIPTAEKVQLTFTVKQRPVATYRGETQLGELEEFTQTRVAALRWVDGGWEMYGMEVPNA